MGRQIKLKQSYKICKTIYKVIFVDKVDQYNSMGNCTPDDKLIKIKKRLSYKDKISTLFHEICHAYVFELKIDISDKDEERLITTLDKALEKWFL